jgi:hypothetical protein
MSRKLRTPKRRADDPDVSAALYHYLLWGDWRGAYTLAQQSADDPSELFFRDNSTHPTAWAVIEVAAPTDWIDRYPGTRPHSWWEWSAPEVRRVSGRFIILRGAGRCQPSGVPYGEPADCTDPPLVESVPAFLDRYGLWLPGERARVPAHRFAPQPFSWDLTVSPHAVDRAGGAEIL